MTSFGAATLARFARLREFTQQLLVERSQRDFDRAAERQARFSEFRAKLERQREHGFDAEVALYVRKLEFTRTLEEGPGD